MPNFKRIELPEYDQLPKIEALLQCHGQSAGDDLSHAEQKILELVAEGKASKFADVIIEKARKQTGKAQKV
jgi:hypothetical protein